MPRGPRPPNARVTFKEPQRLIEAASDTPTPVVLSGDRLELVKSVRKKWKLTEADDALLVAAAEALERAARLADVVERDGGTGMVTNRFGCLSSHPALLAERDFRGLSARILSQLAARLGD